MQENVQNPNGQNFNEKVDDMKDKAAHATNQASDKADDIWEKAGEKTGEAWEEVKDKAGDLADGAKNLWNKVVDRFDGDDDTKTQEPKP